MYYMVICHYGTLDIISNKEIWSQGSVVVGVVLMKFTCITAVPIILEQLA